MRCTSSDDAGRDEKCDLQTWFESTSLRSTASMTGDLPAWIDCKGFHSPALLCGCKAATQHVDLVAQGIDVHGHATEPVLDEVVDLSVTEAGVYSETAEVVDLGSGPDLAAEEVPNRGGSCVAGHSGEGISCVDRPRG